jgi:CheY-like chemotaxis protein
MSTTFEGRRRVLFIDDDRPFLETMQRVMGALSNGSWDVFVAESSGAAFATLHEQPINLVVIDVQMPVMDGFQLLALLNRRHPNLQKVVLTGYAASAENYRAAWLSNGAELFLEKPRTDGEQRSLFATLNELARWQPEQGFRGVLRRVGLQDVIQMECLARSSLTLEVKAGSEQGRIYIKEGSIVHASVGRLKGDETFHRLLALRGGEFVTRSFSEPPEHTIDGPWEFLLVEAARQRDESAQAAAAPPSIEPEPPGIETLPAAPEPAASRGTAPPTALPLTSDVLRSPLAASGFQPSAVRVGIGPDQAKLTPARPAVADPTQAEEVLICSGQGEILYQWQCRNSETWVGFLEFVSQKSRRLAQGFELGPFDRLEIQTARSRWVALVSAQRGILVRLRREPRPADEPVKG